MRAFRSLWIIVALLALAAPTVEARPAKSRVAVARRAARLSATPRHAYERAPDQQLRHRSRSLRKRYPFGDKQDIRVDVAATNRKLEALAAAHPDKLSLTKLTTVAGEPMYRIDVKAAPSKGRGRRGARKPLEVLLSSGVHGNEPTGVQTTLAFLDKLVTNDRLRERFAVTIVPMVNPTGLTALTRESKTGKDLNRSMQGHKFTRETRAVARSLKNERYDLFVDLHGAHRTGFFLIRDKDDGKLSSRILSAMPSATLLSAAPGQRDVGPYSLHGLGGATSNNPGTFKGFMSSRAAHSYTLEYPRRLPPQRQLSGMLRLLGSTLNNVARHGDGR